MRGRRNSWQSRTAWPPNWRHGPSTQTPAPRPTRRPAGSRPARQHLDFLAKYHSDDGIEPLLDALRPHVAGRLCLVGSFITGSTDLHRTPIAMEQPGVTVYPAGIRTILSGVAFRHLAPWQEWVVAILAAWLVAVATIRLSTLRGVAATVALSALFVTAAWMTSAGAAILLPVAGPVLAVVFAFAGISAYRQLTEASTRRWITRVFEQYNSADLVEEIVRNPDRLRLGGERLDITILFSDIAGFTPLSERLEPERLVALLNRYLSAMTALFQAEKGSLDKYVGDGIMAFFGAPIALPDHALRAVRAALAMQDAMPQVNRDLAESSLLPPDTPLVMRIGCSSGPTIVGNFGSEQRFNYTCSGDTVNLVHASRKPTAGSAAASSSPKAPARPAATPSFSAPSDRLASAARPNRSPSTNPSPSNRRRRPSSTWPRPMAGPSHPWRRATFRPPRPPWPTSWPPIPTTGPPTSFAIGSTP